ncbi:hypothetical protein EGR_02673 [Echinococcus granulosus]|uniref:Uncharacterized protein n=1 Tax=Echinococcus granulosus TaxID=6210 RepID=W6UP60_ECHGR|nr:hypothetical protein EGR_02673 [Echinococcus granulosus]EUB62541.1 hypothetical protein EGR_02673 [Echinococcus granulosus]
MATPNMQVCEGWRLIFCLRIKIRNEYGSGIKNDHFRMQQNGVSKEDRNISNRKCENKLENYCGSLEPLPTMGSVEILCQIHLKLYCYAAPSVRIALLKLPPSDKNLVYYFPIPNTEKLRKILKFRVPLLLFKMMSGNILEVKSPHPNFKKRGSSKFGECSHFQIPHFV